MNTAPLPESDDGAVSLTDGALDTLGCVFQTMGSESFALDTEQNLREFASRCTEIARHVENGAPAPSFGLTSSDGLRAWAVVRRFFVDRRKEEKSFVLDRLGNYRGMVEQFIVGLKSIARQNDETERDVATCLDALQVAVGSGDLEEARLALATAVRDINYAFDKQKERYESQIGQLNQRVDALRDDLVATQEDMQLDALTGIYNRSAFDEVLQRHINTRFLLDQPVCVVIIDIDDFKTVNDSFGHTVGDAVLKAVVASMLRSFIRKNDVVARFGGDEFAVILPDTNTVESTASIRRFLESVRKIDAAGLAGGDAPADEHFITCSAGCTALDENDTAESVLRRADAAMYAAKDAGRDGHRIA